MIRFLLVTLVTAALGAVALWNVRLDDDPIRALTHPDPVVAAVFERYQERSPFRGKIFVETGDLAGPDREDLAAALRAAGYREEAPFAPPAPEALLALAPLLPADELRAALADEAVAARATSTLSLATLPGGDAALAAVEADPLGLGPAVLRHLVGPGAPGAGAPVEVWASPSPLDYEKVARAQAALDARGDRVRYIGGDFFSLENYRVVRRDIVVLSVLTLALNLAVFFLFTGRWAPVALLFGGSAVSYVGGLLAVRAFHPEVFAVVLAYTSTFVGFNNESLVHLAGVEGEADGIRRRSLLGIWSAIGTTAIGFLVLLLAPSAMIRQMALASLGGMAGFLLILLAYRPTIREIRFRSLRWPTVGLRPAGLLALVVACAAGIAAVGVPPIATRIDTFRFETPALARAVTHFSARLDALSLGDVVALPVAGLPSSALAELAGSGHADPARHPLARFRGEAEQQASLAVLAERWAPAVGGLARRFEEAGLRLALPREAPAALRPLDEWSYLDLVSTLGPVRWADREGDARFLFVGLRPGADPGARGDLHPLSPRPHYDRLLTGLSRELAWLFLGGLGAMALYLAWLQRSAVRVLYVFAPLFVTALALAIHARLSGTPLNVIHFMGLSLVIALAMDYTAVAVSSRHREVELSKILLTGLATLATFGVLVLARHPVMRDLGWTVAIGCAVSLAFALLVRLDEGGEERP